MVCSVKDLVDEARSLLGVLRTNGCGLGCQFAMNVMPALRSAKVFRAVRGVSLAIDEGELLVLLGVFVHKIWT